MDEDNELYVKRGDVWASDDRWSCVAVCLEPGDDPDEPRGRFFVMDAEACASDDFEVSLRFDYPGSPWRLICSSEE